MSIQSRSLAQRISIIVPGVAAAVALTVAGVSTPAVADKHDHHDHIPVCEIEWPAHIDRGAYEPIPWTNGIVPFEFDANVNATNQARTLAAMAVLEAAANIDFVVRNAEANYIHIQDDTVNRSAVGMVGGEQILRMTSWGSSGDGGVNYIIVHELIHALGFYHEQSRADRATFVLINLDNIQDAAEGNFDIEAGASLTATPYDFDSVMHYDKCAFSDCCPAGSTCNCPDNCLAIEAIAPFEDQQDLMGQRTRLSCLDRAGLREVYNGSAGEDCNNNGTPDLCDIEFGDSPDCDMNGIPDECESTDPDNDGIYNNCDNCPNTPNPMQFDCDGDGTGDVCAIADGLEGDCNANGVPDNCDVDPTDPDGDNVVWADCQPNGIPDVCDVDPTDPDMDGMVSEDCQPNGVPDECDIADGNSEDCNNNNIPDECDIASGFSEDCQPNGIPDECDIADGTSEDCNNNAVPDECDIDSGFSQDCNTDGIPDECQLGNCLNQFAVSTMSGAIGSDPTGTQLAAENFVLDATMNITGTQFWGRYVLPDDNASIHDQFTIVFRNDAGGLPGAQIASFGPLEADLKLDVSSQHSNNSTPVFEYTIDFGVALQLLAGTYWIEIYNNTPGILGIWALYPTDPDFVNSPPDDMAATSQFFPEMNWQTAVNFNFAVRIFCDEPDNDCNVNGIPDDCELGVNDCNNNGIPDECDTKPDGDPSVAVEQDECDNAMLVCPGFDYVGTNIGATNTDGIFFCGLFYGVQDVYYRYRPKYNGLTFIRVEGPPQYWLYAVYDDCPGGGGVEVACNEQDHFNVTFDAEAGHTYYIRIASWGFNAPGDFEMNIVGPPCALADNDLNCNMIPDECECPADVNGDMTVDMADFAAAMAAYGMCVVFPCDADVDGNGFVDDWDLYLILNNQGPCPALPPLNSIGPAEDQTKVRN